MDSQSKHSRMQIIVVYDYGFVNGGAAKVAIAGAVGLAGQGHDVTYFAPVGPADPRLAAAGVEVVTLDQPDLISDPSRARAALRGLWNRDAANALADVLAGKDPARAVVYQHGWSKALSPSSQRVIAKSGLASLYHLHEYFAACPNGAFFDYRRNDNCALAPMSAACIVRNCDARAYSHKLFRVARHGTLARFGRFRQNLKSAIYISEHQKRALAPWLPADTNLSYAPNPVEVDDLGPADIAEDAPFLFVGRFSREKGADLAASAAARAGVPIAFVGDGELAPELKTAAPDADFPGWLAPDDVIARIRQARALVFPSIWHECQPLTVLEALAAGVPVIVSDNCAGAEFVADGETGWHFRGRDVDALAAAMAELRAPDVARRLGRAAYDRYWRAPHSLDRHTGAVEAALQAALSQRNPVG